MVSIRASRIQPVECSCIGFGMVAQDQVVRRLVHVPDQSPAVGPTGGILVIL